ncbi:MAG: YggT family protein [Pyrinomonadaceae bacterium]|jgi:YggT family protein|nr:YggT family protein [Pyrinomonadaceae bacterium]
MLPLLGLLYLIIWYVVVLTIVGLILLMLLRLIVNQADLNPFGWFAMSVRRWTDPLINPIRRALGRGGLDPKYAPLVAILLGLLFGYFALEFVQNVLLMVGGVIQSAGAGAPLRLLGYLLYGVLAIYTLLIFMRIVLSWGMSQVNPLMRFLLRATDPVLLPFRRLIPPVGMFDISPIIVIFLLQLFQKAVEGTLLRM